MEDHARNLPDEGWGEDDYETEAQARTRVFNERGELTATVFDPPLELPVYEEVVEYGAWNQPEYFDPLFASGEIHEALRTLIDEPQFTSNNLRSAIRFADMRNEERGLHDTMGKYGPMIVRTRIITTTPWKVVSYDEIDRARRR